MADEPDTKKDNLNVENAAADTVNVTIENAVIGTPAPPITVNQDSNVVDKAIARVGELNTSVTQGAVAGNAVMVNNLTTKQGEITKLDVELAYRKRLTGFQRSLAYLSLLGALMIITIALLGSMISSIIATNVERISGLLSTAVLGLLAIPGSFLGIKTIMEAKSGYGKEVGADVSLNQANGEAGDESKT